MTLLNPTEAPLVHVEMLPESSIAASVNLAGTSSAGRDQIKIATWAPGKDTMFGEGSGEDADDWVETHCHDCRWHTDEVEWDADNQEVDTPEGYLQLINTYYTQSPCSCYDDGVSSVSFPCHEGLDGPGDSDGEDADLDTSQLKYEIKLTLYKSLNAVPVQTYAMQQGADIKDGEVYVNSLHESVNTYSCDNHICWNDNSQGNSLIEVETAYIASEANEDLCSFHTHQYGAKKCRDEATNIKVPEAVPTPDVPHPDASEDASWSIDNPHTIGPLGKGLAVAHAHTHPSAYMLLATNGAHLNGSLAYIPVYMYPQVAIDDDTIANVWATEPLPTGKRLLFTTIKDEDNEFQTLLLGAVDPNFNLSSCRSAQQLSSAQAEQDSNLSPA